ncbi:MAG TPA: MBL fold metallo-hydrolase [Anaerolineae bacterium]|nr:MBL fold metallo-hydrolase [Anaerolineae bacterium]
MLSANCIHKTNISQTRYQAKPKFDEGLYDLGHNLYAWLVPNGSWGESNAGLIVGQNASLLVDTLWDVHYTKIMLDTMTSITANAPLTTVVNTHADGDHFWGNELVADLDIITSQASYEEMLTTKPESLVLFGRVGRIVKKLRLFGADKVGHWFQNMTAPYDFAGVTHTPAKRTFTGEMKLDIGGRDVHLIEVGPAHTHGDLMVYVPDAGTIYTADILFIGSTPVMWAGPVENWLAALDRILDLPVTTIVPGHGPLTDKDGVRLVKSYWEFLAPAVRQQFDNGTPPAQAAQNILLSPEFKKHPCANWDSPERIMTSTHTFYRNFQNRQDHPQVPELLNIMRRQALLAHQLPDAQPQVMRLKK